ncbi:hypothetical protein DDB_G0270190 [Dictyostelium discoideum AX4]|uniref:Endoglucanase n=1 Tax=Dictyostelium discoideum TaxID=44689 RepID=Q55C74_DICDI|nr:hypothetical protein DDB_G0270190 [Dictyostelium discoideum AX4]EAL72445.1 hypothetical protein DDB_G0270190 [Dictyostelium discoideum AX4]|eukprot:XP_646607.1 hypothetical protein DDB_G0270190 [Dictyostelium discoideum AX4]
MNNNYLKLFICLYLSFFLTIIVNGQQCWNKDNLSWRSGGDRKLTLNGVEITIQGIAWFGMETGTFSPGGLQSQSVESILDILVATGFNALRLPFSVDMLINKRYPNHINYSLNPNLQGKTALEVLQYITSESGKRGILIVLEQHRFDPADYISPLWYTTECFKNVDGVCINYTEQMVIDSWINLTNLFKQYWNLWALDIKNEPHDPVTWGTGNPSTDWDKAFVRIVNQIDSSTNFNGVYFIEGVQNNQGICSNMYNNWWGGNMSPVRCFPIYLNQPNRVVYAPHTYCSSVFDQEFFNAPDYPNNMPTVWDAEFGFLADNVPTNQYAVLLGEWGCKVNTTKNSLFMDRFTQYLNDKNMKSHLFFSLNPDSADTDSILYEDWKTVNQKTMNYLRKINSSPSKFTPNGNQICLGQVSTISTIGSSTTTASQSTTTTTTGTGSTTSKPTTTGGSGSSTTTTKPSTTTTTTTTTTGGSSTTGSSNVKAVIKQTIRQTWFDGTNTNTLVDCTLTNPSSSPIPIPRFAIDKTPSSSWELNLVSSNIVSFTSWNNQISPGQTLSFGYIVSSSTVITFTQI